MHKRNLLFSFLFILFAFTSCQKELIGGNQDYKTLGTSARGFLSSEIYTSLEIQISYMPGYQPDAASLSNLSSFLNIYLNKPGGIRISEQQISASGKANLSLEDIVKIEKRNRSLLTDGNVITAHILITDGSLSGNDVLAKSYWNTSICLFGKTINENSGGSGQITRSGLMTTLLKHEFGHLLGLVGQGTPMQMDHKDVENGAHCSDTHCLMYYTVETMNFGPNNPPADFDAHCKDDLKANGGK
jgi:hypothetical protein